MKQTIIALLLSGLVLPGLGQLYLGRRTKGFLLLVAVNLLLLAALFFAMKVASPVIGARLTGTPITAADILTHLQPYTLWAKLLLAAFFGLWGYSLIDLLTAFRSGSRSDTRN